MKKPEEQEEIGCPLWMVSFGDAMSLLVTFFVMLLSFSTFEEAELARMLGALRGGLNIRPPITDDIVDDAREGREASSQPRSTGYEQEVPEDELSKISPHERHLRRVHSAASITESTEDQFFMRLLEEGLSVVIRTDSMFEPGTTVFLPQRARVLGVVVDMGLELDSELRITSVVPEDTEVNDEHVTTPWGLAARRAFVVRRKISEMSDHFPLSRFSLGTRVEPLDGRSPGSEGLPAERLELTYVGYRDIPLAMDPEASLLRGFLD